MRLNVKTSDTGIESEDWDHIDNVKGVNVNVDLCKLEYNLEEIGGGGHYNLDDIHYFGVIEL